MKFITLFVPKQFLKNYPAIPAESFHLLGKAYHALRQSILVLIHESKLGISTEHFTDPGGAVT